MKISIILPTFKPGDYIYNCLESINSQTLEKNDYEVIIILNGEKEPYYSELEKYLVNTKFKNASLFYINEKGVSYARNKGIDEAQGENILFIDDDDLITEEYLSSILKFKNEKETIIVSNSKCFKDNIIYDDYYSKSYTRLKGSDYNLFNYRKFLSTPWGKLIDKSLINDIRFNTQLKTSEDAVFCFEISKNIKNIILSDENCIYYRRIRNNSASRSSERTFKLINEYILKNLIIFKIYIKSPFKYNLLLFISRIVAFTKFLLNRLKK